MMPLVFALLLSYLLGSIPTAYLIVRARMGVDIRTQGSGNVGATNAGRILGRRCFYLVLALDIFKGIAAVLLGRYALTLSGGPALCGLLAILGHVFPVFLRFRGGKAVGTSTGVFLCLAPLATGLALVAFMLVYRFTRIVSAGSLTAAGVLPLAALLLHLSPLNHALLSPTLPAVILSFVACVLVIYMHRSNIQRLLSGNEHRSRL